MSAHQPWIALNYLLQLHDCLIGLVSSKQVIRLVNAHFKAVRLFHPETCACNNGDTYGDNADPHADRAPMRRSQSDQCSKKCSRNQTADVSSVIGSAREPAQNQAVPGEGENRTKCSGN